MATQSPLTKLQFKNPRLAVASDLPQIVKISQEALPYEDHYTYYWPNIQTFPKEHKCYLDNIFNYYLSDPIFAVHVLELDQSKNGDVGDRAPAGESLICSFVVWKRIGHSWWETTLDHDNPMVEPPETSPSAGSAARQSACLAAIHESARIFAEIAPDGIEIRLMCTDPKYWRHGAASKLVGMAEDRVLVTAASAMGTLLYSNLGFETIGQVYIKVDGEDRGTRYARMVRR